MPIVPIEGNVKTIKTILCLFYTPAFTVEITLSPHNSNFMKRLVPSVMQNVSIFNALFFLIKLI